jgi:hypothetical protein
MEPAAPVIELPAGAESTIETGVLNIGFTALVRNDDQSALHAGGLGK